MAISVLEAAASANLPASVTAGNAGLVFNPPVLTRQGLTSLGALSLVTFAPSALATRGADVAGQRIECCPLLRLVQGAVIDASNAPLVSGDMV